ncbi:hypothetical protein [Heyndrickxia ginsengihumi]|nr:hypothetical protein [Heyndrickxia ginsengihumi]
MLEFSEVNTAELNGIGSFMLGVAAGAGTAGLAAGAIILLT